MKPDKYQLKAIKDNSNILLIAGAGAGKTFTIVQKIKYLIENNYVNPKEILVLSFTNKSVNDLKKKITSNVNITTFHKLAIEILDLNKINYNLVSDKYLNYIINEFFQSLNNDEYKKEVLNYFKESNYFKFLNSYKFKRFQKLITNLIKLYKTNNYTKDNFNALFKINNFLAKYTYIIFCIYENELASNNSLDFDDLIIKATQIVNKTTKYKYIIVDEFQDTSLIRFKLIKKIKYINNATLFCVGDDYQSIYHFSGCNINLFLEFNKLIPNSKILKLKYTYRNSQELINISTKFIMKNNKQIKKSLISNKHLDKPIEYIYYINPYKAFLRLYNKLSNQNLLVLGRNNFDIKKFSHKKINEYLTIHASKGLEAENVIIINLTNDLYGLPNKLKNSKLIEELHPSDTSYLYAEERRLFYVALTRSKNKVYLLIPLFKKSQFIKELKRIAAN